MTPAGASSSDDGRRAPARVIVQASLDDLRSDDVRFLQEAAGLGPLSVRVPSDEMVTRATGSQPRFPAAERLFLARSLRWVEDAAIVHELLTDALHTLAAAYALLVVRAEDDDAGLEAAARSAGIDYRSLARADRAGLPMAEATPPSAGVPRVVVTGCYDWLHSGHIRFFMDAAAFGALYVVVGSDRNVAFLKGPGHPMHGERERRYMVAAVRSVHACLVSSGSGWMDAEPEIDAIRPAFYVVNDDGDQPEKRDFCRAQGIEYVVLRRVPQAGLPARTSTELRGF